MTVDTRSQTHTQLACSRLRSDIVTGRLAAGSKLNIAGIAGALGVSPGAIRESLSMLEAERLVVSEALKGFRVSPVSPDDFAQLVQARVEVEKLCLVEAMAHGDLAWESALVAATYKLENTAIHARGSTKVSDAWSHAHAEYHQALAAACPNVWLLRMRENLYQHSERYRNLAIERGGDRDVAGEHRALMNAVLQRDKKRALSLINEHLQTTVASTR